MQIAGRRLCHNATGRAAQFKIRNEPRTKRGRIIDPDRVPLRSPQDVHLRQECNPHIMGCAGAFPADPRLKR